MSFRAGDTVKHGPTGETWVLACDEEHNEVIPAGWPETCAFAADCTLVEAADDESRIAMLRQAVRGPGVRAHVALRQLAALAPPGRLAPAARPSEFLTGMSIAGQSSVSGNLGTQQAGPGTPFNGCSEPSAIHSQLSTKLAAAEAEVLRLTTRVQDLEAELSAAKYGWAECVRERDSAEEARDSAERDRSEAEAELASYHIKPL